MPWSPSSWLSSKLLLISSSLLPFCGNQVSITTSSSIFSHYVKEKKKKKNTRKHPTLYSLQIFDHIPNLSHSQSDWICLNGLSLILCLQLHTLIDLSTNVIFSAISLENWKEVCPNHLAYNHIGSKRLPAPFLQVAKNIQHNKQRQILCLFMCNLDIYSFLIIFFRIYHVLLTPQKWWWTMLIIF